MIMTGHKIFKVSYIRHHLKSLKVIVCQDWILCHRYYRILNQEMRFNEVPGQDNENITEGVLNDLFHVQEIT